MIQTLSTLMEVGLVSSSLVRVTDDKTGDVTEDYEVICGYCDKFLCSHLSEEEAIAEVTAHAKTHGVSA